MTGGRVVVGNKNVGAIWISSILVSLSNASKTRSARILRRERTDAYATKQKRKRNINYIKAGVAFKCEQDKERADFAQGAY